MLRSGSRYSPCHWQQWNNKKSAQFPATWKGTAAYHTPGTQIVAQTLNANERVIVIDSLLTASRFIASIDEAMSHFDYRAPISRDIGMAMGRQLDQNVARNFVLAARASATVSGGDGGTVITAATAGTNADVLVQSVFDAVTALDNKNVPENDRSVFVKPQQYNLLVNSTSKLINRDYGNEGNGSVADGTVLRIAGCEVVKTNNLPQADDSANANIPTAYQGNYSTTMAIVAQKEAVGTVKLIDVGVEAAWQILFQGWLLVGKYAVGHGILRPECSVEIKTA